MAESLKLTITVPKLVYEEILHLVEKGKFTNCSDYIRHLLANDLYTREIYGEFESDGRG